MRESDSSTLWFYGIFVYFYDRYEIFGASLNLLLQLLRNFGGEFMMLILAKILSFHLFSLDGSHLSVINCIIKRFLCMHFIYAFHTLRI